ncbi:cryptochrome DASH [Rana temporaria]|uniref:cryptochrome DASH n=1 Tax=Rana temporaria TaxID=8407 RepID=UPI001AAC4B69|nr:cryptochrome DASH [Rana temporaria]
MSGPARVIVCLLRNDLRFHDNEVLLWAHRNADHIVPLYCFDPRHYLGTHHYNFPKTGSLRLKFLLESVKDLQNTLKKRGSNLLLKRGHPEDVIEDLIKKLGPVTAVAFQEEATKEELDVEKSIKQVCTRHGVKVQSIWGSTLYHRDDLPFRHISSLPDVYTQFRKAVETQCKVRPTLQMPEQLKSLPGGLEEGSVPTIEDFGQQDPLSDPRTAFPCSGGESQALQRLDYYFWDTNLVASYKDTRNGLIGMDYSTKFAPWLAFGCISPRYIFEQIGKYEKERTANQSTYWVIFELLWRDYFRFVALKYGRRIFFLKGLQDRDVPWKKDQQLFDAWKEGRTGVPFVDANMRELAMTGFMSNRGRQNVASFLTKDLGIDWRMGAEWFEYLLVDYDVCSNYGNWLYSAGIGNDPRENRKFNMIKQGLDYDGNGDYIRLWVPELQQIKGGAVHTPWALSSSALSHANVTLGKTYPLPIVMAPEWSRHINQRPASGTAPAKRGKGPSYTPKQHKNRGVDFYFSRNKDV